MYVTSPYDLPALKSIVNEMKTELPLLKLITAERCTESDWTSFKLGDFNHSSPKAACLGPVKAPEWTRSVWLEVVLPILMPIAQLVFWSFVIWFCKRLGCSVPGWMQCRGLHRRRRNAQRNSPGARAQRRQGLQAAQLHHRQLQPPAMPGIPAPQPKAVAVVPAPAIAAPGGVGMPPVAVGFKVKKMPKK
jgi:hypothetical protein